MNKVPLPNSLLKLIMSFRELVMGNPEPCWPPAYLTAVLDWLDAHYQGATPSWDIQHALRAVVEDYWRCLCDRNISEVPDFLLDTIDALERRYHLVFNYQYQKFHEE